MLCTTRDYASVMGFVVAVYWRPWADQVPATWRVWRLRGKQGHGVSARTICGLTFSLK